MKTLLAGLLVLATLGGSAAALDASHLSAAAAATPTCQDLAGHGSACVDADPSSGVSVTVEVDGASVHAATPTCTDVAGQATVCQDISADPSSGVNADVTADVHPTPPVAGTAAVAPTCQDLAGHGHACVDADPSSGVSFDVEVDG